MTSSHKILQEKQLKITKNRCKIIECLQDDLHFHSIAQLSQHIGQINTKSLYNNLKVLINVGIIEVYTFGGVTKYALNDQLIANAAGQIHLFHANEDVHHITLDTEVYELINKQVQASGHEVATIKIMVHLKD